MYEPRDRLRCFTYHYNLFGATTGTLRLFQVPENDELLLDDNLIQRISGNQGSEWHQAYVNIRQLNQSYQLVFQALRGSSNASEMALDKFSLSQDKTNCRILKESIENKYLPANQGKGESID